MRNKKKLLQGCSYAGRQAAMVGKSRTETPNILGYQYGTCGA